MSVMPRQCLLTGSRVQSLGSFYDEMSRVLGLSADFGRNLDALWDALSADVAGPVELVWEDSAASAQGMGADFDRLVSVLREVEATRDDFRLVLR
jgi:ribonuclease inhibitor